MPPADPRIAALEALFVVTDLGTGRHRLTVPEIASGGIGGAEDGPVGTIGYVLRVKAAMIGAILRRLDEAAPTPAAAACTGVTAQWCPVHGECTCPEHLPGERNLDDERCPLHAPTSDHGEVERADPAPADAISIYPHERDWIAAERAALVLERDEARREAEEQLERALVAEKEATGMAGEIEALAARIAAAEAEIARLRAELAARSPEGRRREQLALFAPPAADPAGEAQRAAASGAAVGAIVGAAADAPAPEAKPRRRVTCSTCSETGHNARGCPKRSAVGGGEP